MRVAVLVGLLALSACSPGIVFNNSPEMTPHEMLQRTDHVFIGVIEKHTIEVWPRLGVPRGNGAYWYVARRRVKIENVLKGSESHPVVDIYEYTWLGGASGDWNSTQDGGRYLFLVRLEGGKYHVVRDWWRSILPISSGQHARLPLDDSHPFWERFDLLQWWVRPGWSLAMGRPSNLSAWRTIKIQRGLLRYPDRRMMRLACENLLLWGRGQDECAANLSLEELNSVGLVFNAITPASQIWPKNKQAVDFARSEWSWLIAKPDLNPDEMDNLRLYTCVNNLELRKQFCRDFVRRFPTDLDNGCPADKPPPATIVTEAGDVPLTGAWQTQK